MADQEQQLREQLLRQKLRAQRTAGAGSAPSLLQRLSEPDAPAPSLENTKDSDQPDLIPLDDDQDRFKSRSPPEGPPFHTRLRSHSPPPQPPLHTRLRSRSRSPRPPPPGPPPPGPPPRRWDEGERNDRRDRGRSGGRYFHDDRPEGPAGSNGGGWGERARGVRRPLGPEGGGGGGFLESRRREREQRSDVTIWAPAPTEPFLDSEEEAERRRAERKERRRREHREDRDSRSHRRARDEKESDRRSHHRSREERESGHRSSSHHHSSSRHHSSRHRSSHSHRSHRSDDRHSRRRDSDSEDERRREQHRSRRSSSHEKGKGKLEADSDEEVGPQLPKTVEGKPLDARAYGSALRAGEGSAIAAYVQEGQRVPRRGEIGLSSEQIENFEKAGFVMSGSRHQRMNAVRMRKENQVISAEEKRTMLKQQREEKFKKEQEIVSQFREMVDTLQPPSR